jgi:peptide/nickel transport system substrate-binding protein
MKRFITVLLSVLAIAGLMAACAPQTVVVKETVEVEKIVKETVKETVVVAGTPQVIEKEVTKIVEKVVAPTATPVPTAAPLEMESPMLAELVKQGTLPPVEERLPASPLVVRKGMLAYEDAIPDFSLGNYGGTLRTEHPAGGLDVTTFYMNVEPVVTGPDISLQGLYGNVFESYEVSPDNTEFTFTLRKGLKWSDGVPVTTEDVRFMIEDLYFNTEYQPTPHAAFISADEAQTPAKFEVLDDYTFKLTYTTPRGSLIKSLAIGGFWGHWPSYQNIMLPKHYLQQWHPKYADPQALEAELKAQNLPAAEWPKLFNQKLCTHWSLGSALEQCIGHPTLQPYTLVDLSVEAATYERNPYYFKVDEAGRQLPYIDKIVSVSVPDTQSTQLLAMNGDLDYYWGPDQLKAAMYMEAGKKIGYELITTLNQHADGIVFFIYGCNKDPVINKLFNDIRFRKAMNYAMNRQEINDNVFLGLASLPTRMMESEYSPDKANALLDEIGMTQRDSNGYRLSPEGQEIKILIEYASAGSIYGTPRASELFAAQLQEVGINVEPRATEGTVLTQRGLAHEVQMYAWESYFPTDPDNLGPNRPGSVMWCPEWNWWEGKMEAGQVVPKPADMPDEFVSYVQAIEDRNAYVPRTPEDAALYEIQKAFYRDNYWALISTTDVKALVWASEKLGNLTRTGTRPGALRAMEILYFK